MARKKKEEEKVVEEPIKEFITSTVKTEEKKRFLECPFCQERSYTAQGRDETSTWCARCGKCYSRHWRDE
jgi:hypothetical protein